jgi:hypothetical protein
LHEVEGYCREVETYLCRKNDGHLIRIVGPSFDRVSGWAAQGIPLKLVFGGIDRYFERYYKQGPRRRPVRIDFCEADVLDLFDEWRRAVGVGSRESRVGSRESGVGSRESGVGSRESGVGSRESGVGGRESLPAHLERVLTRLTQARATGSVGAEFDGVADRVASELDAARAVRLRGAARQALLDRLARLDAELVEAAHRSIDAQTCAALMREADEELAAFRSSMPPEAFDAARRAAADRLIRQHFALPTVSFVR